MALLTTERKAAVIGALVEGASIRSTEPMTGVHPDTITRLGPAIRQAWMQRPNATRTAKHVPEFIRYLEENRPELMDFRVAPDIHQYLGPTILKGLVER